MSPLQWLGAAFVAATLCLAVCTFYVNRWAAQIDAAALSIAENGAPSVIYLSTAREDLSLIEHHAERARPATLRAEQATIAGLTRDFDAAVRAYRTTEDYPGEREAYEVMAQRRAVFFAEVTNVLNHAGSEASEREAALGRLAAATDDLLAATRDVVLINAAQVVSAGAEITALRHRCGRLTHLGDALALGLAIGGTLMGFRAARRHLTAEREESRKSEVRAAELDIFAGRVAHDLRNPLSAILMRCDLASRSPDPEVARDAVGRVCHQAWRMSAIIDALLAFARAGAQPEPGQSCGVAAVVQEILAEAHPSASEAGVVIAVDPLGADRVACDPSVLAVVLSNLVRNAVKYMGEDREHERRITIRTRPRGAAVRIEVEDTGPGIPPGCEARVFEPFVRIASGSAGGVGLGLATVKRLVDAHRGKVGVEPRPGGGSRFWLTLPRAPAPAADEQPAAS